MSVYNDEKNVEQAIKSILGQSYRNFEFMILDDGSSDDSYEIIRDLSKYDERIKLFRNEINIGLTKSLNFLLSKSKHSYIARQDSDDISLPFRFEKQLNFIESNNIDGCTSRSKIIGSDKVVPRYSFYIHPKIVIRYKNPFVHGSLMVKKQALESINFYNDKFFYAQDYKLMKDLLSNGFKIKIIKEVLYELNMSNNISTNFKTEQNYYASLIKKNKLPPD